MNTKHLLSPHRGLSSSQRQQEYYRDAILELNATVIPGDCFQQKPQSNGQGEYISMLDKKIPAYKCLVVLRARSGTLDPNKEKRKLSWTSAGLAFHLSDFSHPQQCGGAHRLTCTSGTSSLLSLPSLIPKPRLTSPVGALYPLLCFSPGQAT